MAPPWKGPDKRKIFDPPQREGLFVVPASFNADDEVRWAKMRQRETRVSQYADSHCGLPNTFDPTGAYLCAGRADGGSAPCNMREGTECLIRIAPLSNPTHQSCGMWEVVNVGDPEARSCRRGKLGDARISFGSTASELGFGCVRCEYGEGEMPRQDSEGRARWCALKGFPVEDESCCADNEPMAAAGEETSVEKKNVRVTSGLVALGRGMEK